MGTHRNVDMTGPLVALIPGILDGAYALGAPILAFKFSNGACHSSTQKLGQEVWDLLAVRLETDQSSDVALKRPSAPQPEDPLTVVLLKYVCVVPDRRPFFAAVSFPLKLLCSADRDFRMRYGDFR
jgi:hypothetical protein